MLRWDQGNKGEVVLVIEQPMVMEETVIVHLVVQQMRLAGNGFEDFLALYHSGGGTEVVDESSVMGVDSLSDAGDVVVLILEVVSESLHLVFNGGRS
jgi:tRNA A37 threonylcarbamoyltransferase TsaD